MMLAERGDCLGRLPEHVLLSDLKDVFKKLVEGEGDERKMAVRAISILVTNVVANSLCTNLLWDLSVMVGGDPMSGLEVLDEAFGPSNLGSSHHTWLSSLYSTMYNALFIHRGFRDYHTFLANKMHAEYLLRGLICDSAIYDSLKIDSGVWMSINNFYTDKSKGLTREINYSVNSFVKKRSRAVLFTANRVEPRVHLLAKLVRQSLSEGRYRVEESGSRLYISLSDEMISKTLDDLENRVFHEYRRLMGELLQQIRKMRMEVSVEKLPDHEYLAYENLSRYVSYLAEPAVKPKDEEVRRARRLIEVRKGLESIAIPWISTLFQPIGYMSGELVVTVGEGVNPLDYVQAVFFHAPVAATYTSQMFAVVHAYRRVVEKTRRQKIRIGEVFEKASSADFSPFLPPGDVVFRINLVVGTLVFMVYNALKCLAGYNDAYFTPEGDFVKDIARLYEMCSEDSRKAYEGRGGLQYLLKNIRRESYDLFLRVVRSPLLEAAAYVADLWQVEAVEING